MWGSERPWIAAVAVACACLAVKAVGQTEPQTGTGKGFVVTDADIERAVRDHGRQPTAQEVEQASRAHALRFDALPQPVTTSGVDLSAIAAGFAAQAPDQAAALFAGNAPSLFVFVSFSMPQQTLRSLAAQASRAGATLVLRGMVDGSLQRTVVRAQEVIAGQPVGFQIDPQAFDRFAVQVVPAYVLVRPRTALPSCDTGLCDGTGGFTIVAGDVSLAYALTHIESHAPEFALEARQFRRRLGGAP